MDSFRKVSSALAGGPLDHCAQHRGRIAVVEPLARIEQQRRLADARYQFIKTGSRFAILRCASHRRIA